jgi:hypothetical protein
LFFALGYDNLRLDVHKSGRELDLVGEHRFEPRCVIAECKAQKEKIGGTELNKFFGALTRERKKNASTAVAGYFVSLAGFTETSIEQEIETGEDRLILLDAQKVAEELERSRVVIARAEATERAKLLRTVDEVIEVIWNGFEVRRNKQYHGGYQIIGTTDGGRRLKLIVYERQKNVIRVITGWDV